MSDASRPPGGGEVEGRTLKELLKERTAETAPPKKAPPTDAEKARLRDEKLAERLANSSTRKFLDGFAFLAFVSLVADFVLRTVGQEGLISVVWWLPWAFKFPFLKLFPALEQPLLAGPLKLSLVNLLALAVYLLVYGVLKLLHRAMVEGRLYLPK